MSELGEPFALSDGDRHSPTWARLKVHLQDRLRTAHGKIEGDMNEQMTAQYRGQIRFIRALLALDDEPPYDG